MGRVEKSIEVKASPEKVWEMLAFDRFPEWQVGYRDLKSVDYTSQVSTSRDKYRVGASAHGVPKKQGKSIKHFLRSQRVLKMRRLLIACMVNIVRL